MGQLSEYHQKGYHTLPPESTLGYMKQAHEKAPDKVTFEDMRLFSIRSNIEDEVFWAIMDMDQPKSVLERLHPPSGKLLKLPTR